MLISQGLGNWILIQGCAGYVKVIYNLFKSSAGPWQLCCAFSRLSPKKAGAVYQSCMEYQGWFYWLLYHVIPDVCEWIMFEDNAMHIAWVQALCKDTNY